MTRRKFKKQFKREAVRLLELGDKSPTELAQELGVRRNQLYKWQRQIQLKGDDAFSGAGRRRVDKLSELEALKRRVAELEEETAILKKAKAYFAKHRQ